MQGPAGSVAGATLGVTITAFDTFGNVATGYHGTVHFTSSGKAALPPTTRTASDAGVHTFTVLLKTAENQTVTGTDTANGALTASILSR